MNYNFNILWQDFEQCVDKGIYERVPYEEYRKCLKPLFNKKVWIDRDGECDIKITPETENYITTYWYPNDGSFGAFLNNQCFPSISEQINSICKNYCENNYNTINKKENNSMNNKIVNFDFGPCKDNNIRMSMYGLAVMSPSGNWVSFDSATNSVVDVDIINFEGKNLFYKIPIAIKDIKVGDTIVHNRKAMFVKEVTEGATSIVAVDAASAEVKTILPVKSMFGFDFYTKIVSLVDFCGGVNASVDTPFGNILPMIMLAGDTNINDILPMLMLTNGNKDFMSNPMMLYFLTKEGNMSKDSMLPLMFLMNNK